jgi:hypothetical protein
MSGGAGFVEVGPSEKRQQDNRERLQLFAGFRASPGLPSDVFALHGNVLPGHIVQRENR